MSTCDTDRSDRAVTPVLGIVLLIGIVAVGSMGILLISGATMDHFQSESEQERIEQAFTELSQSMGEAAADGDVSKTIDLDLGDNEAVAYRDTGSITIQNGSNDLTDEPIRFGTLEYEGDDGSTVAFEAGGVFRDTGDETIMLSAPPIHYAPGTDVDDETFTFSLLEIAEDGTIGSGEIKMQNTEPEVLDDIEMVENEIIEIRIESYYYKGWAHYFESQVSSQAVQTSNCEETNVDCEDSEDLGEKGVTRVLLGEHIIANPFDNAITAGGDVIAGGNVEIDGDVILDGDADYQGNVDGDEWEEIDDIDLDPLDSEIDDKIEEYENDEALLEDHLYSVEHGDYYSDGLTLSQNAEFDISDGNTTIVIDGGLDLNGHNIDIDTGSADNNRVEIYMSGELSGDGDAEIIVDDEKESGAEHFQIYGTSEFQISSENEGETIVYNGVIYAPTDDEDHDTISGNGNFELYGSIVAGNVDLGGGIDIYWDEELEGTDTNLGEFSEITVPEPVTYLNLAQHDIEVEEN